MKRKARKGKTFNVRRWAYWRNLKLQQLLKEHGFHSTNTRYARDMLEAAYRLGLRHGRARKP